MKSFVSLRWLSPKAVSKFFDTKELVAFVLPTTGFYYDFIPKVYTPCTDYILLIVSLIFFMILIYGLYRRYMDYEKAIAEVLETSYFSNFVDHTVLMLRNKIQEGREITFRFVDGSFKIIKADRVFLKLIIPLSKDDLTKTMKQISAMTKDGNIDGGQWMRAAVNADGTVTIYECPRILLSLSRYLINSDNSYSQEQSVRLHEIFNQKFDSDWENIADRIMLNFEKSNSLQDDGE